MRSKQKLATTFLAIELPERIRDRLVKLQKKLNKINNQVVWELPEKLHVTFVYLGKLSDDEKVKMTTILKNEAKVQNPFNTKVGYLGHFYKKHGTGIIWIGVETNNQLENFHKQLVKALNQQGFSLSDKKLVAHITLGRLKKVRSQQQLKILDKLTGADITGVENMGEFMIDKISVMTSHYLRDINTTEFQVVKGFEFGI